MFKIAVFVLLTGGVLGAAGDEVKRVSVSVMVMEGDSVTLNPDQKQKINLIKWTFKGCTHLNSTAIAEIDMQTKQIRDQKVERFRDRLMMDNQTGSLTIRNMTTEHSGLYEAKIDHNNGTSYKYFTVIVCGSRLPPGAEAGILLAVLLVFAAAALGVFYYRNKISNLLKRKCGQASDQRLFTKEFNGEAVQSNHDIVTIEGDVPKDLSQTLKEKRVMVKSGDSVALKPDVELRTGDQILWMFGPQETHIAELGKGAIKIFDGADGRFKDRLKLDKTTGSLIITNITAKHAGVYKQQTIRSGGTLCQSFTVTVRLEKSVKTKEGESVPLNPDVKLQKDDEILWMFGPQETRIAKIKKGATETFGNADKRFRDRLKLDMNTGSLTITNISAEHAGIYKLLTISSGGNLCICFTVTVRREIISEVEGQSVQLCPDTQVEKEDLVLWMFGDQNYLIAQMVEKTKVYHVGEDGRFIDRLKLDKNTGSLTIRDTRAKHSGLYKLQISNSRGTSYKKFRVDIQGQKVSRTEGSQINIKTGVEMQKNDLIQWHFGDENSLIAELKGGNGEITMCNDARFRDRLTLDKQTGSLTITNITTEHAGVYKLKINSGKVFTNNSFNVVVRARMTLGQKGKTVTLNPDADIEREDLILWTFGYEERLIAQLTGQTEETTYTNTDERFRDRLELNKNTGALSITNITPGLYKLQISSSSKESSIEKFRVFLCCESASKTVSVTEGETFIFITDFTIERDEKVQWRFEGKALASGVNGDVGKTSYADGERFRDRLELHHQTGSLSIRNSRRSDSGVYQLHFRNTCWEFKVTV